MFQKRKNSSQRNSNRKNFSIVEKAISRDRRSVGSGRRT